MTGDDVRDEERGHILCGLNGLQCRQRQCGRSYSAASGDVVPVRFLKAGLAWTIEGHHQLHDPSVCQGLQKLQCRSLVSCNTPYGHVNTSCTFESTGPWREDPAGRGEKPQYDEALNGDEEAVGMES